MTRKFGPLPADVVARLSAAAPEELEQLADRLLDAQRLEDVLKS